jgi:transcriptional regulator with XRE-family HTH domain
MATISERINEALLLRGMKQADLVEMTGIGKSSISTYISGAYEPKQRNIYKIAKALNVNESWLMGNDVPMERKPEGVVGLFTGSNTLIYGSYKEEAFLQKYRLLDEKGQHTVNTILEMEYLRCNQPNISLNAAHEIPGATAEDKAHDDALMDDENF